MDRTHLSRICLPLSWPSPFELARPAAATVFCTSGAKTATAQRSTLVAEKPVTQAVSSRLPIAQSLPNCASKKAAPKNKSIGAAEEERPLSGLVDIDANFLHDDFVSESVLEQLLQTARSVGVVQFVTPVVTLADCEPGLRLAEAHPGEIFVTAGVHPFWTAADVGGVPRDHGLDFSEASLEQLRRYAQQDAVRCVGECGLDFVRGPDVPCGFPSLEAQMPWFEAQVGLACELQKPLFLHVRDAFQPFMEVIARYRRRLPPAVMHAFTGSEDELQEYVRLGFFIGVTGSPICQKTAGLRTFLPMHVPLDRLLVETDAPYMGFKGCRSTETTKRQDKYPNVPAALPKVVRAVAECYGVSVEEVAAKTAANARLFFRMPVPRSN